MMSKNILIVCMNLYFERACGFIITVINRSRTYVYTKYLVKTLLKSMYIVCMVITTH